MSVKKGSAAQGDVPLRTASSSPDAADKLPLARTQLPKPKLLKVLTSYQSFTQSNIVSKPRVKKTVRFKTSELKRQRRERRQHEVLHPKSALVEYWKMLYVPFFIITFVKLPVNWSFGVENVIYEEVCDLFFVFDHVVVLNTGFIDGDGALVKSRWRIFRRWLSWRRFVSGDRANFWVLVLELVPLYVALIFTYSLQLKTRMVVHIAAVARLRRVYDLLMYFRNQEKRLDTDVRTLAMFKYVLILLGSAHWFACIWWFAAKMRNFDDTTWIRQYLQAVGEDVYFDATDKLYYYQICLFWGFMTLSNMGYFGYTPQNGIEVVLNVVFTFVQLAIYSYLFGILLHFIVKKDSNQERQKVLMGKVDKYVKRYAFPHKVAESIRLHFQFQHMKRIREDVEIMSLVPVGLRTRITGYRYNLVAANDIFKDCQDQFVSSILTMLKPKVYVPGTVLYKQNELAREVAFIESGEVEAYDEGELGVVRVYRPSETCFPIFGEFAFFMGTPRTYALRAAVKSDVKILTLSKEDYEDIRTRYPESRDMVIRNTRASVGLSTGNEEATHAGESQGANRSAAGGAVASGDQRDIRTAHMKRKVMEALQRKLDDEVANMHNAIRSGDMEEVKAMLTMGYVASSCDYDQRTGLHFAAVVGSEKIVELLMQRGAEIHLQDRFGRTALRDAVENSHRTVAQLLISQGAELRIENAACRLCSAAADDNLAEVQRLLDGGLSSNLQDYDGRTALHLAAAAGHGQVVEYLLLPMHKTNTEIRDRWDSHPLLIAIQNCHEAVARALYEAGSRLDSEKVGLVHVAAALNNSASMGDFTTVRLLNEAGISLDVGDYYSRYPVHLAATNEDPTALKFLMFNHANLNVYDRSGWTPLDEAVANGHWRNARLFCTNGTDHSQPISPEAQSMIDAQDINEIGQAVKAGKARQKGVKEVEHQLRDSAKWLYADSGPWVSNMADQLRQLERVSEKALRLDLVDITTIIKDAHGFLEQTDEEIVQSDRPKTAKAELTALHDGTQGSYMLARFLTEQHDPSGDVHGGTKILRSLQHFFLQLHAIQSAFENFRERLAGGSITSTLRATRRLSLGPARIDAKRVSVVLRDMGVSVTEEEAEAVVKACKMRLDDDAASFVATTTVSFEELVTSLPLWSLILRAPVTPAVKDLQYAVRLVFEGYRLIDTDGDERITRAEWRVQKRENDLGYFAKAIDQVFERVEKLTLETFFVVVLHWAGLQDLEDTSFSGLGLHGWGGNGATGDLVDSASVAGHATPRGGAGGAFDGDDLPSVSDSSSRAAATMEEDLTDTLRRSSFMETIPRELGDVGGRSKADVALPVWVDRLYARWRLWMIYRRIRSRGKKGQVASWDEVVMRFKRYDNHNTEYIAADMAELLIASMFDVDLPKKDWIVLLEHLQPRAHPGRFPLTAFQRLYDDTMGSESSSSSNGAAQGKGGDQHVQGVLHKFHAERVPWMNRALVWSCRSPFIRLWRHYMENLVYAFYYFSCPYYLAFLGLQITGKFRNALSTAYVMDALHLGSMILRFNTSFIDERSVEVFDRAAIRRRYLNTTFLTDLLCVIPFDVIARFSGADGLWICKLRMNKLVFTPRLWRAMNQLRSNTNSMLDDLYVLVMTAVALIHQAACYWYLITDHEETNYLSISGYTGFGDYHNGSDPGGFFSLKYYAMSYMIATLLISTQGMPGLIAVHLIELYSIIASIVLNLTTWSYLMGAISGLFLAVDEEAAASHELMSVVLRFLKLNKMPADLTESLKAYFMNVAAEKSLLSLDDENMIYKNLPLSTQAEVARIVTRSSVAGIEIFQHTSDDFIDAVSTVVVTAAFSPGEFLYMKDDVCHSLYIITSGLVEVVKLDPALNTYVVEHTVPAGEAVGVSEFLYDIRHLAGARVPGPDSVRVLRLVKDDFRRLAKLHPIDEDVIYNNLGMVGADDGKVETASKAPSQHSSIHSFESNLRSIADDEYLEKALDDIAKAKTKGREQRVRFFCNAALLGNMANMSRLLTSGIDVNEADSNGRTALMLAACSGSLEVVKWLVSHGAKPNPRDKFGSSALLEAVRGKHKEIIAFLTTNGAVLQLPDPAGELCQAAAENDVEKLQQYLGLGVSANVCDYQQRTPLHVGASEGHLDVVKLLVLHYADVNAKDVRGGTPLIDSIRHGHLQVQKFLRDNGGKIEMKPTELGVTLCAAAAAGRLADIKIHVENGADINAQDYDGRTALHLASCNANLSVIEYLVTSPAIDINALDRRMLTPLDAAIEQEQTAIANVLLSRGGLQGDDPKVAHKVAREKERWARAKEAQFKARVGAMTRHNFQKDVLQKLTGIYSVVSERMPALTKTVALLSMTLRHRRSTSVVDRSPRPTLSEVRCFYYMAFKSFLEGRYLFHLEECLTLAETYRLSTTLKAKCQLARTIYDNYLSDAAPVHIQLSPQALTRYRQRMEKGAKRKSMSLELVDELHAALCEKLEEVLPEFFKSEDFYKASRKQYGYLWRLVQICRSLDRDCQLLLDKVMGPLLALCREDALSCVPHFPTHKRAGIQTTYSTAQKHLESLKRHLCVVAFMSQEAAMKDRLRETHAKTALGEHEVSASGKRIVRNA